MVNKKGWIRIVEAFVAIVLIIGAVLIIIQRQADNYDSGREIKNLERNIIDFISRDDSLRSQVLSGNLSGVNKTVADFAPGGISYSIRACTTEDICSLGCYVDKEVYSHETLIVANLTYYVPENSKKLKIFMWEGTSPSDCKQYEI